MQRITTDGIVIGTLNFDESDRLLTILSGEHGVLRAYARGARRTKSKLSSSTELMSYSRFVLFRYQERTTVDAADINTLFWNIRQDIEKLALASYLCELSADTSPVEEEAQQQLRLLLNCLALMDAGKRKAAWLKPLFELRQISLAGYMPDLVACQGCGCYETRNGYHFYPTRGAFFCEGCDLDGKEEQFDRIGPAVLSAMRHIIFSDFDKLFSFTLQENGMRVLTAVCERYIKAQLSRTFHTLEFYHAMVE